MATDPVRVVVSSYGTEGDSRPLIELATWLRDQGDEVTLLLEADGAAQAKARGLPVEALAGDLREALDASAVRNRSATILRMARTHVAEWARATRRAAEHADVVVGSGLAAEAGQVAALAAGRPFVGISMFPVVPTAAFPPPLVAAPVPRPLNRLAHSVLQRLFWRTFGRRLGPVCREWGMALPPLRFDDHPTLCTASPTLLPTPADWPAAARVVGDLRGDPPTDPLDPRLLDFLHDGPPPVYVGFGSMATPHAGRLRAAIMELAASHRVLFAPGWSGITIPDGPGLLSIGTVPHDALFPHVAAAVHHGGAGTLHAAARSGVPQIVVPMGGDQAWWARHAYEAGIATAPLRLARLTGPALADAVRATEPLRPRAAVVAAAMAGEDGRAAVRRALHDL
jgi:sterol 3beta-glucosyltransferase